jgi:hypothetical protein
MERYVVTAAAAEFYSNFSILVSVSNAEDGSPVTGLKLDNFEVHHLWSLGGNHNVERKFSQPTEAPNGFYTLYLKPLKIQPKLYSGHYVFGVIAKKLRPVVGPVGESRQSNEISHWGQTVAKGDLP